MKISLSPQITNALYTKFAVYKKDNKNNVTNKSYINAYPSVYYTSFAARTPKKILESLDEKDFPSAEILKRVQKGYKFDTHFSLYNAHKDYYEGLLGCSTLDEAKKSYPEFSGVKDANDIPYEEMSYTMKQIKRGEGEINIEDLSLALLKNYYARAISMYKHEDENFGFSNKVLMKMFEILNIPMMSKKYSELLYYQNPAFIKKVSAATADYARKHPETAKKHAEFMRERAKLPEVQAQLRSRTIDPLTRQRQSEVHRRLHTDNPELARRHGRWLSEVYYQDPANRAKLSEAGIKFNEQHPEYGYLQSCVVRQIFPDYCRYMKEVAKDFIEASSIMESKHNKIPLTPAQKKSEKMFYAKCNKQFPGIEKQIGAAKSILMRMLKIKKDGDSDEQMRRIEEFFSDDNKVKELMLEVRGFITD